MNTWMNREKLMKQKKKKNSFIATKYGRHYRCMRKEFVKTLKQKIYVNTLIFLTAKNLKLFG